MAAGVACVSMIALTLASVSPAGAEVPGRNVDTDFNGDGLADLAVGAPGEDIGSASDTGAVTIVYGTTNGLNGADSQLFHQDRPGVPGANESGDRWGDMLEAADFNGDGFTDLAVAASHEDIGSVVSAGAVTVLYGSTAGLTPTGSRLFHQGSPGLPSVNEFEDLFGTALGSGDLNGDGYSDLIIGTPREDVGSVVDAGVVTILRGSPFGLSTAGVVLFHQNTRGVPGVNEVGDLFGFSLATGTLFDNASNWYQGETLVVGSPGEAIGSIAGTGAVTVLDFETSLSGKMSTRRGSLVHQGSPGVPGVNEVSDNFGFEVIVDDFRPGVMAMAIGAPAEDVGSVRDAGAVTVVEFKDPQQGPGPHLTAGPTGTRPFMLRPDDYLAPSAAAQPGLRFGSVMNSGDVTGSSLTDLIVGVWAANNSGASSAGLTVVEPTVYSPGGDAVLGFPTDFVGRSATGVGSFGLSVATGDFDGSGREDLVVGAFDGGAGDFSGFIAEFSPPGTTIDQESSGVVGASEFGDFWGAILANPR